MDKNIKDQVEQIVAHIQTQEDITEIEKAIQDAKGKVLFREKEDYWTDKTPCWEMFHCPDELKAECPAYKDPTLPCWEVEGTYCKLFEYGAKGDGTDICKHCRAYKKYGDDVPIKIKLRGKGLHTVG